MCGCHGQGASFVDNATVHIWVFTSQCKRNGSGETGKKWVLVNGCRSAYLATVSWASLGGRVLPLLCWLTSDLSVSSPSLYGGLGFQGADLGWEQVYAARFAAGGRTTGQSDWQTDGGKDRKKKKGCVKNPSGCETWANVELKQSMTILFYSPLSTWAPEALCDVMCVLRACVPAQQCVHSREPGRRWETRGGERRRLWAEPSPRFIPACSVTSALWLVAVLNRRAIIWCQVVQRPQTSVMALPRCTVSVSLGSMQPFTATLPQVSTASFIHSFSSCQPPLHMINLHALCSLLLFSLLGPGIEPQYFLWYEMWP